MKTLSDAWLDKAWNIAGELVALNNIPRHRLFGYIIAEHLTGAFSCAKRAADPDNEAATCATHCGDFARCITAPAPALAASAPSQAEPPIGVLRTMKTLLCANLNGIAVTASEVDAATAWVSNALSAQPSQAGSCQASEKCEPALTECPRCKNDINKCDGVFAPPAGRTLTDIVNSMPITWELSWGSEDEESLGNWLVHECSGSRNDREWKLIGEGATPADAILAAASTTGGDHG